jgi:hypothetical protein
LQAYLFTIDDEGYTAHQVAMIEEWYQSGIEV